MGKLTYKDMYKRAARAINRREGNYKGYTGANALFFYVNEKYGVNALANPQAHRLNVELS